jgi:hypothetical protein
MIAEEVNIEPHKGELRGYHVAKIKSGYMVGPIPIPIPLTLLPLSLSLWMCHDLKPTTYMTLLRDRKGAREKQEIHESDLPAARIGEGDVARVAHGCPFNSMDTPPLSR